MTSNSSTPKFPPEQPDDGLDAFYQDLEKQENELGAKRLEELSQQRRAGFARRSERRLKSKLHRIASGSVFIGLLFLIAFFALEQNPVLGWIGGLFLVFGAIAFFTANPDALEILDDTPF